MPGRLIAFIIMILVIGTYIGFNIGINSDLRIWFGEKGLLKEVPILLSFFAMYIIGLLSALLFIIARKVQLKAKKKQADSSSLGTETTSTMQPVRVLGAKPSGEDGNTTNVDESELSESGKTN